MSKWLHGLHDPGGEHLMSDKPGWIVFAEAIGSDPNDKSGKDFTPWTDRGFTPLVRINNGWAPAGTIPEPSQYANFARRCANYVQASRGAVNFIIGNEPNHLNERPGGKPIEPQMYADCYNLCYEVIKSQADAQIAPAAVAPWDNTTAYGGNPSGNFLIYWKHLLNAIGKADFLIGHAYTHGHAPALVRSLERHPEFGWFWHFSVFIDLLSVVPHRFRGLPFDITECDQVDAWLDTNSGWVREIYYYADEWNKRPNVQKIRSLSLYRWQKGHDKWDIETKQQVQQDFRGVVNLGFLAGVTPAAKPKEPLRLPFVSTGENIMATELPRALDPRLKDRGVTIETPPLNPGEKYWRIVEARWWNEQESQGRHHIFVEALDSSGKPMADAPFVAIWPSGSAEKLTNGRGGFDAGNFPMSKSLNEFSVMMKSGGLPSEKLRGIGMGADGNSGIHTSTGVVFQLATYQAVSGPKPTTVKPKQAWIKVPDGANLRKSPKVGDVIMAIPYGEQVQVYEADPDTGWVIVGYQGNSGWMLPDLISEAPLEELPKSVPVPLGDTWNRAWPIVLKFEGGLSLDPNDTGNYYQGRLVGTKYGISAAVWGGQYDIPSLTKEQALSIYYKHYWQASGADKLPWPMALIVFDTAVNHGVGTAKALLTKEVTDAELYLGLRMLRYVQDPKWQHYAYAWGRRVEHLDDIARGEIPA